MLHASSLVRYRRGYVFCARSGSGKTTVARLSPEATLLSDEISMVTVAGGRVTCHGTPFWGELGRGGENVAAPVAGLYFLRHGERHRITAIGPRRALERLLPNVLFFVRDAELVARVLAIAGDLVEAAPCFELAFTPDRGFWTVIDHA